jgi:hypothetical protein
MAKFVISYDLIKGKDYAKLINHLTKMGACRVLESVWLSRRDSTAIALRDDLKNYIDKDDRLVVIAATGEAAWTTSLTSDQAACMRKKLED